MKLFLIFLFSVFTPLLAGAEVHCSGVANYDCNIAHANCITVDAVLGQAAPQEESEPDSVE